VQVVIALIVTPEGFPLAYEVLPGNTTDKSTLKDFLAKIEDQYGKAERIWVMDRGIPTEDVLGQMRGSTPPVSCLVGTPKGKLTALEQALLQRDWQQARPSVRVKLLAHEGETYVLAESQDRVHKERSMRRRRLRKYLDALQAIAGRKRPMQRDALHQAIGAAKKDAGRDARFVLVEVTHRGKGQRQTATLTWRLDRTKLREAWRREGRYLLRTNLTDTHPAKLWAFYLQLTEVEQAFKELTRSRHPSRSPFGCSCVASISLRLIQRRPVHPTHPPSARPPHRSPHLRQLPGLCPASHPQSPAATKRHRADPESRAGEVRHHANARRALRQAQGLAASAHHRRTRNHPHAPHAPRKKPAAAARPTPPHPARTTNNPRRGSAPRRRRPHRRPEPLHETALRVVQTHASRRRPRQRKRPRALRESAKSG
jgi:hypothetical protein